MQAQYPDLHVVVLSNQGNYITIIVNSIISSMLVGAALAIIVLAIFLKDIKPTLVVGISIPLSVLFAVVLMYFTGLDMNIMTLAGLSLGVGMLVDNSVSSSRTSTVCAAAACRRPAPPYRAPVR